MANGWKRILYSRYCTIDPTFSLSLMTFPSDSTFSPAFISETLNSNAALTITITLDSSWTGSGFYLSASTSSCTSGPPLSIPSNVVTLGSTLVATVTLTDSAMAYTSGMYTLVFVGMLLIHHHVFSSIYVFFCDSVQIQIIQ